MRFKVAKQRKTPQIIIIALVDVLVVLLIFLVVTTTFKTHPAFKMALPESQTAQQGNNTVTNIIINVPRGTNIFFVGAEPYDDIKLTEYLTQRTQLTPDIGVSIRADNDAPFGQIVKLMDVLKNSNVRNDRINAFEKPIGKKD